MLRFELHRRRPHRDDRDNAANRQSDPIAARLQRVLDPGDDRTRLRARVARKHGRYQSRDADVGSLALRNTLKGPLSSAPGYVCGGRHKVGPFSRHLQTADLEGADLISAHVMLAEPT